MKPRVLACTTALISLMLLTSCTANTSRADTAARSQLASSSGDETAVKSLWQEFFNTATPLERRQALLQNGAAFADVLKAEAVSGPMSVVVDAVRFSDVSHATVSFALRIGTTVRLPSVAGAAVRVDGRWLVSKSTMCVVLAASGQKSSACS